MKEKTTAKRKIIYYVILAASVLLLTAAIVLTVYFVAGGEGDIVDVPNPPEQNQPNEPNEPTGPVEPDEPTGPVEPDQPGTPSEEEKFVNPVSAMQIANEYDFYHNQTLNWFYEHQGVDISAAEGTEVYAMADGTVERISYDELHQTEIVISHSDGVKTVYRFVSVADGIGQGSSVKKGQKIATIAEAKGEEYKDGAHLHLEVLENGVNVNPTKYLTADEK